MNNNYEVERLKDLESVSEEYHPNAESNSFVENDFKGVDLPIDQDGKPLVSQNSSNSESKTTKPNLQDNAKKSNSITGMFTTTAVAVGVVAASTIFAGGSDANIVKVKGFEDSIFYHVDVPYEDNYQEGSLKLIIESQLDEYEIALEFGETYGFLPSIPSGTDYDIILEVGSTLGTSKLGEVQSTTAVGFQSVVYYPKLVTPKDQDLLDYTLRIYSEDKLAELSALTLETSVYNPYTEEYTRLDDISLQITDTSFTLTNIPNENRLVDLKVIGTLQTGEQIQIESETFITPLKTIASGYVSSLSNVEAKYSLTPDFIYLKNPVYTISLYDVDGELESVIIDDETDDSNISFDYLYPNTKYGIQAVVTYEHPITGISEKIILSQDEFVTPDKLDVITSQTKLDTSIEYNITAEGNTSLYTKSYVKDQDGNITFYDITLLDANTIFIQLELPIASTDMTYEIGFSNDEDLFVIDTLFIEGVVK